MLLSMPITHATGRSMMEKGWESGGGVMLGRNLQVKMNKQQNKHLIQ